MVLLSQDRDPSTSAVIPPATTVSILPPSRGSAVYNYSCARYLLKNDSLAGTVATSDLQDIRWVQIIDPNGDAAEQQGLNSRNGTNFLCGDECKSFPVEAEIVGDSDLETLELQVTNADAVNAATVTLEIYGRALCVPEYRPIPA